MNILSFQSQVVYGHVGNSAAAFILQRLGHQVWQIPTVLYSNHLGKQSFKGGPIGVDQAQDLVSGLEALNLLSRVDAVLTGYLGTRDMASLAMETVEKVKSANPKALFACDPVMGDDGALYVRPELAEVIAGKLAPKADLLLPNKFELERLAESSISTEDEAFEAMRRLWCRSSNQLVIATGICDPTRPDEIACLALDRNGPRHATTIHRDIKASGSGDCFAALFLGHYLKERDLGSALDFATRGMNAIIAATADEDADELRIVETQDVWADIGK